MKRSVDSWTIPLGAYGIGLSGLEQAADLLVEVGPDAPAYAIAAEVGSADAPDEYVDDDSARLRLRSGGEILIERAERRVMFRVPHPVRQDELVHPYLAPAAAVIARWAGLESMHAGAFAAGGRALGVVGVREAGKSSTLAWLARAGVDVLCDDMLIVDGARPLAGPRSIDLRADAAERLGVGEPIGMTGARERWRLRLGPTGDDPVLGGWVFLAWGERVEARLASRSRAARPAGAPARATAAAGPARRAARADLAAGLGAQPAAGLGVAAAGSRPAARARVSHTDCSSVNV